jgi:intracellular multiplication protein IcmE
MSDTNTPDDQVVIPEGEPQNFAEQRAKKGMSPGLKLGILVGGVFSILGASFFMASAPVEQDSVMRGAPSLDATPGGALQAENPLFRDLLEQANDQRARDALDSGDTFIPVPEGQLEPVPGFDTADAGTAPTQTGPEQTPEPTVLPPPPQAPRVIEQRVIPAPGGGVDRPSVTTNAPQKPQNPYLQGIIQQMGAMSNGLSNSSSMGVFDQPPMTDEVTDTAAAGDTTGPAPTGPAQPPLIAAGTVLYGETLTSSSSDLPGPVLVQVTNGPFKGGRLVGKFATAESVNRMIVEFTSMTLPDGNSVSVSAFAVDGISAETAVASDVNRRYIQRYAPLLAAAFITGYAGSAAQPEQQVVELGDGNTVITGTTSGEQNLYAGLAAAGEAVGADLIRNAPKGPEVILRSGWPIGIMFVEPVAPINP